MFEDTTPAAGDPDDLSRPFSGLTVLDVSQGMAGPHCAQILGEQGARVIKVEPPRGDWARTMGRPLDGSTAIFAACNAGKESVVLDARSTEGKAALARLADQADIVVESFRPGIASRMGLDPNELRQRKPRMITVSINGFGSQGPLMHAPAVDTVLQAAGGLMSVNQDASGTPRRVGFYAVDLTAGTYAAQQAAAALYGVSRHGRGRHIEVTLLQAAASLISYFVIDDAMFPEDRAKAFAAPSGVFETTDGHLQLSALTTDMFERLAQALPETGWSADADLATNLGRVQRAAELNDQLAAILRTATAEEWEQRLADADVLMSKVRTPREIRDHPQAVSTELFSTVDQSGIDIPWRGLPGGGDAQRPPGPIPGLGQHTEAVLAEFAPVRL